MRNGECLLVADSRVQGWLPRQYPGWTVRTVSRPGGQLATVLKLASESLRPETLMLVIRVLHCELISHQLLRDVTEKVDWAYFWR